MMGALVFIAIVIGLASVWSYHWLSLPRKERKVWKLLAVWGLVIVFVILYSRIAL